MKILKTCLAAAALTTAGAAAGAPPQLAVLSADESITEVYPTGEILKVTFDMGRFNIRKTDGITASYPPGQVSRIVFDAEGRYVNNGIDIPVADRPVSVYPNPVVDSFRIDVAEPTTLDVYSSSGMRMLHIDRYEGSSVDATGLTPGLYIVKTNSITAKFIKS